MKKLTDYPCQHENTVGFPDNIIKKTGLPFPESYNNCKALAVLAMAMKEENNMPFCSLPFCHTVEAEALGGHINLGDGRIGPRPQQYAYTSLEDLLETAPIDFSKGRIHEVLRACALLKEQGEKVALQICGPYSILSCLLDLSLLFKRWRKEPQLVKDLLAFISNNLLDYVSAAGAAGVDIISYADPAGSLKILGPKYTEETAHLFTLPFLQKASEITASKSLLHLCPKTTLVLTGLELAELVNIPTDEKVLYAEAALAVIGKTNIIGQACLQDNSHWLNNGCIKAVRLR